MNKRDEVTQVERTCARPRGGRTQAPGSGPGGRRFKSSLPDQLFSVAYVPSKLAKIHATGKNVTVFSFEFLPLGTLDMSFKYSPADLSFRLTGEHF
jgi:hypothetical protein